MRDYLLFRFCSVTGLASEDVIRAGDDLEATRLMRAKAKGAACELWLDARLVAILEAESPDARVKRRSG